MIKNFSFQWNRGIVYFLLFLNYCPMQSQDLQKEEIQTGKINLFILDKNKQEILSNYTKENAARKALEKKKRKKLEKKIAAKEKEEHQWSYKFKKKYKKLIKEYPQIIPISKVIGISAVTLLIIFAIRTYVYRNYDLYKDIKSSMQKENLSLDTIFTQTDYDHFKRHFFPAVNDEMNDFLENLTNPQYYEQDLMPHWYKNLNILYTITEQTDKINDLLTGIQQYIHEHREETEENVTILTRKNGPITDVCLSKVNLLMVPYNGKPDGKEPIFQAIKTVLNKLYPLYIALNAHNSKSRLENISIIPNLKQKKTIYGKLSYNNVKNMNYHLLDSFTRFPVIENTLINSILTQVLGKTDLHRGKSAFDQPDIIAEKQKDLLKRINIINQGFFHFSMNIMSKQLNSIFVNFDPKNPKHTIIKEKILQLCMEEIITAIDTELSVQINSNE
jgi:hypothetical protein